VNVGSFIVAHAQTAKLIEPCKGALDYPPPASQAATVRGAPHRHQRQNAAISQPVSNSGRVVAAVPNHAIWPTSWPSTCTLEGRNGIDESQCC
jgi:hypothetical protein